MSGRIDAAECLLKHGARLNAIPPGFDYAGTGLHYAAFNGHRPLVEYLLAHGILDMVVARPAMAATLARLINLLRVKELEAA